jgi:hypothetical protein
MQEYGVQSFGLNHYQSGCPLFEWVYAPLNLTYQRLKFAGHRVEVGEAGEDQVFGADEFADEVGPNGRSSMPREIQ